MPIGTHEKGIKMKKVLLATTMMVATASIAAADVTLSGSARMGVISNFSDRNAANGDESNLSFTSRARVQFNLAGETDSGLAFGASFRADNASAANSGDAGSVFISGAFGKLSMGDVDGAAQMATGHVDGVGLTGLSDLNESTFLGAGDGVTDPTALYEYTAGSFSVFASVANPVVADAGTAVTATRYTDTVAYAVGAKYATETYSLGIGYENLSGVIGASTLVGAVDDTDLDHIVLKVSGTFAGVTAQGLVGQADGRRDGAVIDNAKQYAASISYTTGALTGSVFYTDDSALPSGATAYGLGGSYDLGGGASVVGGVAKNVDTKEAAYDLGVSFSF